MTTTEAFLIALGLEVAAIGICICALLRKLKVNFDKFDMNRNDRSI